MAVTIKDNNRIPDLLKQLSGVKGKSIEAGVLEDGEQAMIAHVHEYGIRIAVTPKMRGYLSGVLGIHLRRDTTHIVIPERSFIRSGWDQNEGEITKKVESLVANVLEFGIDGPTFMDMIGKEVEGKLKDQLVQVSDPPLHPATIERKGSSNPLVDTGSLNDSISYKVK